jgi:hypothetical protein
VVLKTSVASMTSKYMITTLASMTSTASLASKQNQKLLALYTLSDFPGIRILSSLNDLGSLNDLSGLNDLNSLISSKNCLNLMVLSILVPQFYGFNQKSTILWIFGTHSTGGCGGHGCYFQLNPRVISQMSASHKCTNIIFMT